MKLIKMTKPVKAYIYTIVKKVFRVVRSAELQMATVLVSGVIASSLIIYRFNFDNANIPTSSTTPIMAQNYIDEQPEAVDDSP